MRKEFPHDFVAGRLHVYSQSKILPQTTLQFKDKITKLLKESGPYKEPTKWRSVWVFANVEEKEIDGDKVLFGIFGKIKEKGMENTYDIQTKRLTKFYIDKNIAQSFAFFIINPKTQVIIFEEKKNLRHKKFKKMFARTYNFFYDQDTTLEVDLLKDETELLDDLETKKVIRIVFNIRPSNPETRREYELIDDLLQKARAESAEIKLENEDKGLSFEEKGLTRQGVGSVSAGYGDYKATVEVDDEVKTISSKDSILREVIYISDFSAEKVIDIINKFKKYFKSQYEKGDNK